MPTSPSSMHRRSLEVGARELPGSGDGASAPRIAGAREGRGKAPFDRSVPSAVKRPRLHDSSGWTERASRSTPGGALMRRAKVRWGSLCLAALGCGSATPRQPPGAPPTPASVTVEAPGGDAYDPHEAALLRQLTTEWGYQLDKDRQLRVPLSDDGHWKRVRFRFVDHFTGFRYGDERHLLTAAFVMDTPPGEKQTSETCMARFEERATEQAESVDAKYGEVVSKQLVWKKKPLLVHATDGGVSFLFRNYDFSAAWAAYPAYKDACLVYAVVVRWEGYPELARKVRDRWVEEGFATLKPLTRTRPYRKED